MSVVTLTFRETFFALLAYHDEWIPVASVFRQEDNEYPNRPS
jgi:hypothetical protein